MTNKTDHQPHTGSGTAHPQASTFPMIATSAGVRYFRSAHETLGIFQLLIELALRTDFVAHSARRVLDGEEFPQIHPADLARSDPGPATRHLRSFRQPLLEMTLAREIDNFLTFISESIRAAIKARPGMLKSRNEVRVEHVLSFSSMDEFVEDLVDRKVSDLSYLSLRDLSEWINDRCGLMLFSSDDAALILREAVETRNCIVHARGIVGDKYLKNVESPEFAKGAIRTLSSDYLYNIHTAIAQTVAQFDASMAQKFDITRLEFTLSRLDGSSSDAEARPS